MISSKRNIQFKKRKEQIVNIMENFIIKNVCDLIISYNEQEIKISIRNDNFVDTIYKINNYVIFSYSRYRQIEYYLPIPHLNNITVNELVIINNDIQFVKLKSNKVTRYVNVHFLNRFLEIYQMSPKFFSDSYYCYCYWTLIKNIEQKKLFMHNFEIFDCKRDENKKYEEKNLDAILPKFMRNGLNLIAFPIQTSSFKGLYGNPIIINVKYPEDFLGTILILISITESNSKIKNDHFYCL